MKFLVTGAAGFVGRTVCETLVSRGYEVRAIVREADDDLLRCGVKIFESDLLEAGGGALEVALSSVDVIIHCAGNAKFGNGAHYFRENTALTRALVSSVRQHAAGARFVYVSTIGAVDRAKHDPCLEPLRESTPAFPSSDYGLSKLMAEDLVKASGLEYVIVRPSMVVGAEMRQDSHFSVFARKALTNSLFARVAWPGKFSIIHAEDLAAAILFVSLEPRASGETYFCAGEAVVLSDFLAQCNPGVRRIAFGWGAAISKLLGRWLPFELKALLLPALTASDAKLSRLGWEPRFTAREALAEVLLRERCRIDPLRPVPGQTVITGAASGLGRAFAEFLSSRRGALHLIDKDQVALEKLAARLGNCAVSVVDLSNESEVDMLLKSQAWCASPITELFACAGFGVRAPIQRIQVSEQRKMFAVNVLARIALTRNVINQMRRNHFGRVVLISSSSAFQPMPFMATYAATNSALLSLGEAWRFEVAGLGIHVMTVCPGGMETNFQKSNGVKQLHREHLMAPQGVVKLVIDALRDGRGTLIVPFRSFAMSLLARLLPRSLSVALWGRLMKTFR